MKNKTAKLLVQGAVLLLLLAVAVSIVSMRSRQTERQPLAAVEDALPAQNEPSPYPQETPQPFPDIPQPSQKIVELEKLIENAISDNDGEWGVFYMDLTTGESVYCAAGIEKDEPMVCASLIKLFVMAAVFEQIEAGTIDGEGAAPLLESMITISDNLATNQLIRLLGGGSAEDGFAAVNDFAKRGSYASTSLNRLMLDDNGLQNYSSAQDCGLFLERVYRGECVSEAASEKMLELLLAQTRRSKIPAGLPEGTSCANKTGELSGLSECDAAIVFAPDGDYILCVMSQPENNLNAIESISELSQAVYSKREK